MDKIIRVALTCILAVYTYSSFANDRFDMSNIIYYQSNYDYKTKKEDIIAYVLKDDPCVTVQTLSNDKTKRYCKMGESGLNLKTDNPSIYVMKLYVSPGSVNFIVAAPWNEQRCRIMAVSEEISCQSTGL